MLKASGPFKGSLAKVLGKIFPRFAYRSPALSSARLTGSEIK